jgi:hypothetical protein
MLTLFWEAAANEGVRILLEKNYQYSQKENNYQFFLSTIFAVTY